MGPSPPLFPATGGRTADIQHCRSFSQSSWKFRTVTQIGLSRREWIERGPLLSCCRLLWLRPPPPTVSLHWHAVPATLLIQYVPGHYQIKKIPVPWLGLGGGIQRKTWCMGPDAGVDYNSPYVHSRVDSITFTLSNPILSLLCQNRLYPPVRDLASGFKKDIKWTWSISAGILELSMGIETE